MPDWTRSMAQTFEFYEVNPNTWKDRRRLDLVKSCTIKRDSSKDTLGGATFNIDGEIGECYIRVYLLTSQDGIEEKFCLGTFLIQTSGYTFDGKIKSYSIEAYTPLLELSENNVHIGHYIPKGTNILEQAYMLARDNMRAPITAGNSEKNFTNHFAAGAQDTYLKFILDMIAYDEYQLGLEPDGSVFFSKIKEVEGMTPTWTFNDDNSSILYPSFENKVDLYKIPNVVEVIYSDDVISRTVTVRNDDPDSITSTYARGREIVYQDTKPSITQPDVALMELYGENLLKNLSSTTCQLSYTHGYCPVRLNDCVRLNYTRADMINTKAKVIAQEITCDEGCSVTETAVYKKYYWKE